MVCDERELIKLFNVGLIEFKKINLKLCCEKEMCIVMSQSASNASFWLVTVTPVSKP